MKRQLHSLSISLQILAAERLCVQISPHLRPFLLQKPQKRKMIYLICKGTTKCKCEIGSFDGTILNIPYLTDDSEKQALWRLRVMTISLASEKSYLCNCLSPMRFFFFSFLGEQERMCALGWKNLELQQTSLELLHSKQDRHALLVWVVLKIDAGHNLFIALLLRTNRGVQKNSLYLLICPHSIWF